MIRVLFVGLALLAVALLPRVGAAEEGKLQSAHAQLDVDLAAQLNELADWCTKKRLYGRRDVTYAALLEVDPDHAEARKRLKYKRDDSGAWVQSPKYKAATNWNRGLVAESETRLEAIQAEHRMAVLDLLEAAATPTDLLWARREVEALQSRRPGDERPPKVLRALVLRYYREMAERGVVREMEDAARFLRMHHPRDVAIRSSLGEVERGGIWILRETAETLKRQNALAKAARKAVLSVEVEPIDLDRDEAKVELPWKPGVGTADLRVIGTADEKTLEKVAQHAQAAGAVFEAALGKAPSRREDLTLVVLAGKDEDDTFIANYPVVDNPSLQQRKKIGLDLVYLHGSGMLLRKNPPEAQLDLAVNTVLNQILSDTFLEHESPRGWHAEGISRYLAYALLGTRLSINVVGKYAGQGGDRHVPESKASWLSSAKAQLKTNPDVGLQLLMGKGVDTFGVRDAVLAYAFAVYLLEAHSEIAASFVRRQAETSDVDKASREILGLPRTVLEQRFVRWLDEVIAAQAASPSVAPPAK